MALLQLFALLDMLDSMSDDAAVRLLEATAHKVTMDGWVFTNDLVEFTVCKDGDRWVVVNDEADAVFAI